MLARTNRLVVLLMPTAQLNNAVCLAFVRCVVRVVLRMPTAQLDNAVYLQPVRHVHPIIVAPLIPTAQLINAAIIPVNVSLEPALAKTAAIVKPMAIVPLLNVVTVVVKNVSPVIEAMMAAA